MAFKVTKASTTPSSSKKTTTTPVKTSSGSSKTGSNSLAMAQQAVSKGYVKSVDEYNAAVSAGQAGAKYGYSKSGSSSNPTYTANTSYVKPPYQDVNAPIDAQAQITDMQGTPPNFAPETGSNIADANAFVSSVGATQGMQTAYDAEVAQRQADADKQQNALTKMASNFDLPSEYRRLQREQGVGDITKQLQEANLQLSQMQSQYQLTNQELAQQAIPEAFVIGQQNELGKTAAIKIGAQASYVQALQGNLDLANHYVDQMIDLEAKDYEQKYNAQKYNLEIAMNYLGKAEAKQAKEIDYQLDLKKADYSNMLDVKKSSMQNALLNGANSATIQAIANAKTSDEVYSAAGRYAVDPTIQAQLKTEQLQQDNIRSQIAERDSKALSGTGSFKDTETRDAGFAVRTEDADKTISNLENFAVKPQGYLEKTLPNIFKSKERQTLEQAERNFINATLRRESGAVISDEEFANARQQYIPQIGDRPETLAQKSQNRNAVIGTLKTGAGGAYDAVKASVDAQVPQTTEVSKDANKYIDDYLKTLNLK